MNKEATQDFVRALLNFRIKNVFSTKPPDYFFRQALARSNIGFGYLDNAVSLFIRERGELIGNLQPKYVLSPDDFIHADYELWRAQHFTEFGFNLYARRELKCIVFFTQDDKNSAVFYYRTALPCFKIWHQYPDIDTYITNHFSNYDIQRSDIAVFHRYAEGQVEAMKIAKSLGKKIVWETDDLESAVNPDNPVFELYKAERIKNEFSASAALADLVTVTTENLKSELQNLNSNIKVLPNKIDLTLPVWNLPKIKSDKVRVLWAGLSTHRYDLQNYVAPIINAVGKTDSVFIICGYNKTDTLLILDADRREIGRQPVDQPFFWDMIIGMFNQLGDKLIVKNSLPVAEYPEFFTDADIIIAPLKDNKLTRSKSGLKALEAGAYSLPVVATDLAPYRDVITNGVDGFLASSPSKFGKRLLALIKNPDLRKMMGENLRRKVERKFSAEDQKDRVFAYLELLN